MAHFTHYAEKQILNVVMHNAGITAFLPYLGLFSALPTDATSGTEITGNAYARQAIAVTGSGAVDNGASSGSTIAGPALIVFPSQTPGVYVPVAFGLFDALTAGNLWWWEPWTFPTPYNIGDNVQVPLGYPLLSLD